jgi:hypothetical protein
MPIVFSAQIDPFSLDPDNHVDACFGSEIDGLTLQRVAVDSHVFFGPQKGPNRATAVPVD